MKSQQIRPEMAIFDIFIKSQFSNCRINAIHECVAVNDVKEREKEKDWKLKKLLHRFFVSNLARVKTTSDDWKSLTRLPKPTIVDILPHTECVGDLDW